MAGVELGEMNDDGVRTLEGGRAHQFEWLCLEALRILMEIQVLTLL